MSLPRIALTAVVTVVGAAVMFAAPAQADPIDNYTSVSWPAVCAVLDESPTFAGIEGVGLGIVADTGWTLGDAGRVIKESIAFACPRHVALWNRFVVTYQATGVV